MNAAAIIILLVSHQGYWLAGQDQSITIRWAAKAQMPPADLIWEMGLGPLKLAGGSVPMIGDRPAIVALKAPDVRVRTRFRLAYRLVQRDNRKDLEAGEFPVNVFPADLTADWAGRLHFRPNEHEDPRKLLIWDGPTGLPKALETAKVPFTRVDNLNKVLGLPDIIIVGADQIDNSPFAQGPLVNLAAAGSSIGVLEQKRPDRVAGYALARRDSPEDIRFRPEHPLVDRFSPEDLRDWVHGAESVFWAVQLPPDEPALEVAWWARESPGGQPVPIDALIVTKSVGRGRIVLCQMPLGPWEQDPRSQIFLGNLLSYLGTRPEPTPPPSERRTERPLPPPTIPSITIPPGANP